jgi:ribulose-5-phosphate 4-epimerase/fuculose-1-phosphate aldolase
MATAPSAIPQTPDSSASSSRIRFAGRPSTPLMKWFARGVRRELARNGHPTVGRGEEPTLVVNLLDPQRPQPYRRGSQGTFVMGVVEVDGQPEDLLRHAYPVLVRSLSNLLVYITHTEQRTRTHFVTLEQGYYTLPVPDGDDDRAFFREVYRRVAPLASTRLVINNVFETDLEPELWDGTPETEALMAAGRRLDAMDLLPAAFPIAELLSEREMNHVKRLFGIGGLSYGNLSVRHDADRFWMSARGVNKGKLLEIGRDVLLITGFRPEEHAMTVSVPPHVEPRAASVDAIEHWCLYTRHPGIGAIIHVHAWLEGVPSTRVNYPCGTYELAEEVAELVAAAPDPSRAVVGLKNHGLTITGHSLDDIFQRVDGKLIRTIPME